MVDLYVRTEIVRKGARPIIYRIVDTFYVYENHVPSHVRIFVLKLTCLLANSINCSLLL